MLAYFCALIGTPTWIAVFIGLICIFYYYGTRNHSYFSAKGIPSVSHKLPFLGNMLDMIRKGLIEDVNYVKKYGKVFGQFHGQTPLVVLCDPELIRQVGIKDFSHFINRRNNGFPINREFRKAMTVLEDMEWKAIRNVVSPTFSSAKMKKIVPLIQTCAKDFVNEIEKKADQELELKAICGCFTMDVIVRTQFSVETNIYAEKYETEIIKYARKIFSFNVPLMILVMMFPWLVDVMEKFEKGIFDSKSLKFFSQFIEQLITHREQLTEKPNDFLQLMLGAHSIEFNSKEDEEISAVDTTADTAETVKDWRVGKRAMSREEILANATLFFLAGYETSATSMCWLFHLLAYHPEAQEKLYEEVCDTYDKYGELTYEAVASMKWLDQVFCEVTRLYPAAHRADRVCKQSCKIGDYLIEKGDVINFGIYAIHHNDEYWPEAEKFKPQRFSAENRSKIVPYSYLTFGIGPRNCVGQRLAVLELKIGVAEAIKKFRFLPSESSERYPEMKKMGMSQPVKGIHLRVEIR